MVNICYDNCQNSYEGNQSQAAATEGRGIHIWPMGCKHGKVDNSWSMPMLSESDSILCTNFKFCEGKIYGHCKNILIYKAKQFMMTKGNSRKVYIF